MDKEVNYLGIFAVVGNLLQQKSNGLIYAEKVNPGWNCRMCQHYEQTQYGILKHCYEHWQYYNEKSEPESDGQAEQNLGAVTEVWWDEMTQTVRECKPNCEKKEKPAREAKVHRIKCVEPFFTDIDKELKTFELRKNDRDYRQHDFLELMQYIDGKETGKHIYAYVEYLLEGYEGIQPGYCIMGIERIMSNTPRDKRWREDK